MTNLSGSIPGSCFGLLLVGLLLGFPGCTLERTNSPEPESMLTLAEDGKAVLPIVVSAKASNAVKDLAIELASYLERITGASFACEIGDGSTGIALGTIEDFESPSEREAVAKRDGIEGKEGYVVRTERKRLRLMGASDLGVSHAIFALLEHLGCRWFFPAPEWEIVPRQPTLRVAFNQADRPIFLSRRIWWGYGFFDRSLGRCQRDYVSWARHNRMASSIRIATGHAWQALIKNYHQLFETHSEYLALISGTRKGDQLCVSNPAVRKLAVEWTLKQFDGKPELEMVSLECSDGDGQCECEACLKLGTISDRVFGLANEVARAVAASYPGKMIGTLAYNEHCEPPTFPLEPNVYVQSTAGFIRGKYTFSELVELWPRVAKNLGFYEYFSVWLWDFDMPPGGHGADVKYIQSRISQYASLNATSLDCESGNNWGLHGRGYYIASKLMWNPRADVSALLEDFYSLAFGPASAVMRRYYERLDPGNNPIVSEHLLALALRDLLEAEGLAKDRSDVLSRLDQLKQYQHYVRLRWDYDHAGDKGTKREMALAALTYVYRTRYSYMNHWAAMLYGWTSRAAKEFEEPAWSYEKVEGQPWRVERQYSTEETKEAFRGDLERFQPDPVQERSFSKDYKSPGLTTPAPAVSSQQYQRGASYLLRSEGGEPLEFMFTTGMIAHYRDRAPASYRITDSAGKEIVHERLPQDGAEHSIHLDVLAGIYRLDFEDQGAGWSIRVPAGKAASLILQPSSHPISLGQLQRMYFYVPKGTQEMVYFWKGGAHDVYTPDGKIMAQVKVSGKFVRISVPAGADGRPWSIGKLALGELRFLNLPNVLAASPDALVLPKDIVEDDGLPGAMKSR